MSNDERWSWEQGSKVISEWRRSGLSMAAYSRWRGVGTHRLRYWRDQVEAGDDGSRAVEVRTKLVAGVVVGEHASARLSVHLPRGVVVEAVSAGDIEPAWLADVVTALERA